MATIIIHKIQEIDPIFVLPSPCLLLRVILLKVFVFIMEFKKQIKTTPIVIVVVVCGGGMFVSVVNHNMIGREKCDIVDS